MNQKIVQLRFDLRYTVHLQHYLGYKEPFPYQQGTQFLLDFQLCPHPIYEPTDEILKDFPAATWTAMIYPDGEEINRNGETKMTVKPLDCVSKEPLQPLSYIIDAENHLYAFLTTDDEISKPFDLDYLSWAIVRIPVVVGLVSQLESLNRISHTASIAPSGEQTGYVVKTDVEYLRMA
jgi:hypothetical protein